MEYSRHSGSPQDYWTAGLVKTNLISDRGILPRTFTDDRHPSPVEVIRTLGRHWPDRQLAVTMNWI